MYFLKNKYRIATLIALLLHGVLLAGILFSGESFFLKAQPYQLLCMFALILYTQENITAGFILFFLSCFIIGLGAEIIGTAGGGLFGDYSYGTGLGRAYRKVPLIIGIQWFVVLYCCGITVHAVLEKLSARLAKMTGEPSPPTRFFSVVTDGALLAVFFDWIMEPAAAKLGWKTWTGSGTAPLYNYICWFVISAGIIAVFSTLKFSRRNIFAVNLLLILMMFFMLIRTFM